MNKNYDRKLGPGKAYAWPSDLFVAKALIEVVPSAKSSANCLSDYFFYQFLGSDQDEFLGFDKDEALDLREATAKSRQELFKDAKNWSLLYLVASAVYEILSKNIEMSRSVWRHFLWLCLSYNEPLFDMVRAKRWDKIHQKSIGEGFKSQLIFEIKGLTGHRIIWSSDEDKPWFACKYFTSHIYPEDVFRCLDLVGIDQDLAHLAVDQLFKLQSLTPFYHVLLDNPSLKTQI